MSLERHLRLIPGTMPLRVPPLGFGAFKIGRNQGIKYATGYELPALSEVRTLLDGLRQLGCQYFDTAPAYGLSEERLGSCLDASPPAPVISTKVGETFAEGRSVYDYSRAAVEASLQRSCERLRRDVLDLVFVHSNGDDLAIQQQTDVVKVLQEWRDRGAIRSLGFSGKTPAGAAVACDWADALMVEYHQQDVSHADVMLRARERGLAVIVKKGLASGKLPAEAAIRFVLSHPAVTSLVIGGLSLAHFTANWQTALAAAER